MTTKSIGITFSKTRPRVRRYFSRFNCFLLFSGLAKIEHGQFFAHYYDHLLRRGAQGLIKNIFFDGDNQTDLSPFFL